MLIYLGPSQFKSVLKVPKQNWLIMVVRCLVGVANITTANTVTKYFKLSTVSVLMNTTPLVTLTIGVQFFGERASKIDVVCIVLSFIGVMLVTLAIIENKDDQTHGQSYSFIHIFLLMLNPFWLSGVNLTTRVLRKMHP